MPQFDFPNRHGQTLSGRLEVPTGTPKAYGIFAHCFTCSKNFISIDRADHMLSNPGLFIAFIKPDPNATIPDRRIRFPERFYKEFNMSATLESVQKQLDQYASEFAKKVPAEVREAMNQAGKYVADFVSTLSVIGVDDEAPNFVLPDATGNKIELQTLLREGPVVLSFYRGRWCPYCNIELQSLQAALPRIVAHEASLVAVSPQTPDESLSTSEKNELEFSVLSDLGNSVAREYGLVFTLPEPLRPIYADFGIDLRAHNGDESFELPVPATYVIDRDAKVRYAFVNADYRQRAEPSDIVASLAGLDH